MTITIPTGELVGVLADVLPFACTDTDLPHINVVRIEWDGTMLHAEATDTLHAARSSWGPDDVDGRSDQSTLTSVFGGADDPWALLASFADVKEVVKDYKLSGKEAGVPLTLDYHDGALTIRRSRDTRYAAKRIVLEGRAVDFPRVGAILDELAGVAAVDQVAYSPAALARLGAVRPRGLMRMRFGGQRTQVTIGDRFLASIAPDRSGEKPLQATLAAA
ncbi:hypothetical protein [Phytohabitans houttuyneae]|uniref:Uncharacterized protein n=1 Tax=Phytohabitans houttuyneae TaxID=1076126 RepID=A0A6V8KAW9_9ACTN|nr:hypothetical protein [Phytohabitans houttuyneae]GFJ79528.1 hypothetical protein Phou_037080 [Phytohabitans houttuyneae]